MIIATKIEPVELEPWVEEYLDEALVDDSSHTGLVLIDPDEYPDDSSETNHA